MNLNGEQSGSSPASVGTHPASRLDIDCLARLIADDIITGDQAYAEKHIPIEILVDLITPNIHSLLNYLEGGTLDLGPAYNTGRVKAEHGMELSGVLHAYRLAGLRLWRELAMTPDSEYSGKDVFPLGAELWTALDDLSTAAAEAHREATGARERWAEQSRIAAVIDLLSSTVTSERRNTAAHLLQLDDHSRFFVMLTDAQASGIEVLGACTHWAEIDGGRVCLLALRDRTEFLSTTSGARAGFSEEFHCLDDAAEAARQARIALKCLNDRAEGIYHFGQSPTDTLICSQPSQARQLVRRTFAELRTQPQPNRDMLLDTFEAWVESGGSLSRASEALYCHRNTVNYRLRKFETLASRSISDPADLTALTTALRTIRLLDWPESA
ncbi:MULTISPECIES: PucR family transcriptional regulator [unclassified Brevibacterium]|uniref:PucR family transcriptional regulator n=1 Tax=unclassified Brevibacterium TaxID=2614124 RepID=UPI000C50FF71|nr:MULTISPECIES: PucR family transcriptional regulator [unclassified Brevibacterium]SMX92343.1 PucR C-terminal helix-turn-helix domain-containing protein [Brevibacterium sp. 239c]